jgi:hypothetical protein
VSFTRRPRFTPRNLPVPISVRGWVNPGAMLPSSCNKASGDGKAPKIDRTLVPPRQSPTDLHHHLAQRTVSLRYSASANIRRHQPSHVQDKTNNNVEIEFALRLSVGQSLCLGIDLPCGTFDLPVGRLLSEIYGPVSVGRPLWREDGSAICSVLTEWSESRRTRKHTLLSHQWLHQPGGPGSRIYIPQEQGGPVIPRGTRFPLHRLLRLVSATVEVSNPPQPGGRGPCIYPSGTEWSSQKSRSRYLLNFLRQGPHSKRRLQRFFFAAETSLPSRCLASIWGKWTKKKKTPQILLCLRNVLTEQLPSNDRAG